MAEAIYILEVEFIEKSTNNLESTLSVHRDELPGPKGTRAKNWHHLPFQSVLVTGSVVKILIKQAISDI